MAFELSFYLGVFNSLQNVDRQQVNLPCLVKYALKANCPKHFP